MYVFIESHNRPWDGLKDCPAKVQKHFRMYRNEISWFDAASKCRIDLILMANR